MKRAIRIAGLGLLTGSAIALASGMAVARGDGPQMGRGDDQRAGQHMKHRGPQMRPSPMVFEDLDVDGNGQITTEDLEAKAAERFSSADADGDGALTHEELTAAGVARFEENYAARQTAVAPGEVAGRPSDAQVTARAEKMASRMLERADADNSGTIEADEMSAGRGMARLLERADTDGDGALSEAEFETAQAKMAERFEGRDGPRDGKGPGKDGRRQAVPDQAAPTE